MNNIRLKEIVKKFIECKDDEIKSFNSNDNELYNYLANQIGMTDNEIDEISGNFEEEEFEN